MESVDKDTSDRIVRTGPFKSVIPDGIKAGSLIFLSGQVSVDAEGKLVGRGDFRSQHRQVYQNITKVLAQFGARLQDVVEETVFVTDIKAYLSDDARSFELRRELFSGEPQIAQTLVQVARLASPDWLIEIRCVALAPAESK